MTAVLTTERLLSAGASGTDEALAVFDQLDPVSIDFMLGDWCGAGVPTQHPMDGLLENFNWFGKSFVSAEDVHPLVFSTPSGTRLRLDPRWMPMKYAKNSAFARHAFTQTLFARAMPLLSTRASRARLRMLEYRGKSSATMIYDDLPINDTFRRVNDNTVLGLMDLKGMRRPFFFQLSRVG